MYLLSRSALKNKWGVSLAHVSKIIWVRVRPGPNGSHAWASKLAHTGHALYPPQSRETCMSTTPTERGPPERQGSGSGKWTHNRRHPGHSWTGFASGEARQRENKVE